MRTAVIIGVSKLIIEHLLYYNIIIHTIIYIILLLYFVSTVINEIICDNRCYNMRNRRLLYERRVR